jgi:hypothetical protein
VRLGLGGSAGVAAADMNRTRTYDGAGCQGKFSDTAGLGDDAGRVAVDGSNAWRIDFSGCRPRASIQGGSQRTLRTKWCRPWKAGSHAGSMIARPWLPEPLPWDMADIRHRLRRSQAACRVACELFRWFDPPHRASPYDLDQCGLAALRPSPAPPGCRDSGQTAASPIRAAGKRATTGAAK